MMLSQRASKWASDCQQSCDCNSVQRAASWQPDRFEPDPSALNGSNQDRPKGERECRIACSMGDVPRQ